MTEIEHLKYVSDSATFWETRSHNRAKVIKEQGAEIERLKAELAEARDGLMDSHEVARIINAATQAERARIVGIIKQQDPSIVNPNMIHRLDLLDDIQDEE